MKRWIPLLLAASSCAGEPLYDFQPHPFSVERVRTPFVPSPPIAPPKQTWSLEDLIASAEQYSPDLEALRLEVGVADAGIKDAGLWPNPTLAYSLEDLSVSRAAGHGKHVLTLSQPMPLGGRLRPAVLAAEYEREARICDYEVARAELRARVTSAFAGLLYAQRRLELVRELRGVAKQFADAADIRFKAGDVAEMEVLKATVSLSRLDIEMSEAGQDLEAATRTVGLLVGNTRAPAKVEGALESVVPKRSFESLRGFLEVNPALRRAEAESAAAQSELALARSRRLADPEFSLGVGRNANDNETILQAGITIPLPLFDRQQAKIQAAELRIRQAYARAESVRNRLLSELSQAWRDTSVAQESVRRYESEILPLAQKAFEQTSLGYVNKKFTYIDVLDAQRTLFETRAGHLASLRDLAQAVAEVARLTGGK